MPFTNTNLLKDMLDLQQVRSQLPPNQDISQFFSELQAKFHATTGHTHAGTSEDGPNIPTISSPTITSPTITAPTITGAFSLNPGANYNAQEGLNDRFRLVWIAGQRGKPGINADIQSASEAVRMIADPDFEILGTNAISALCTFNPEGGIVLTTAAVAADQMILAPHLDANQSAWTQATWGLDQSVRWECLIKTGASIVDAILWAGLKLTNTPVTVTDNDQVFLRYEEGIQSGNWQAIYSIGGTDTVGNSAVTVAINTVYHFVVIISAARIATMYINEVLVATSTALTDAVDLIPYIGVEVQAGGAAGAKAIRVRGQSISRVFA